MSILKVLLKPIGRSIVFSVLDQHHEQIASDYKAPLYFEATNGWKVYSRSFAEINAIAKTIHLRGFNKDGDHKVIVSNFHCVAERDTNLCEIKEALAQWSKNNGFRGIDPSVAGEADVFEF